MNNYIAVIKQNPVGTFIAFGMLNFISCPAKLFLNEICDGMNLIAVRAGCMRISSAFFSFMALSASIAIFLDFFSSEANDCFSFPFDQCTNEIVSAVRYSSSLAIFS